MEKLGIALIGLLGTLLSFMIDNGDILFNSARWIPVTLSTLYIIWKWNKERKKK
ncbi:hypothetical protein J0X14_14160 [Muricauda sp. CAU 1633]|uniref:hypothetical protein n=1 Tax=Allomuricauda sp. CAU 1633 TaxID=2816036 RepID=UPI001A909508|nr:hypothetical protein [Muricauda sp. CAU 1633]MBO0323448.1 hypothetical protein [Muricauda sp. CAU 1633]